MKRYFYAFLAFLLLSLQLFVVTGARAAGSPNMISNPSVETVSTTDSNSPQGWFQGKWGTNTSAFSYPATGNTGSRSVRIDMSGYSSGDAKWYFAPVAVQAGSQYSFNDYYESSVATSLVAQFDNGAGTYSYMDLGSAAASSSWAVANASFTVPAGMQNVTVFHLINQNGWLQTDDYSLTAFTPVAAPTVSLTAPTAGSAITGSTTLSANASDANGVAGVQFKVDGANVGAEVTASPYQTTWNSSSAANGSHTITAVARNTAGVTATSSPVQITVNNPLPNGVNLIANGSMETADPANANAPQYWQTNKWGTNTSTFSYPSTGAQSGTRSLKVQTTSYSSGDAKWFFNYINVQPGTQYSYSEYYMSNIVTDVVINYVDGNGVNSYVDLGSPAASSAAWKQFKANFVVPAGAKTATVFHLINGVGSLQIDNVSLTSVSAPTVSVITPSTGSTVSGTVALSANASDTKGITSVQYRIDGVNIGSPVTTSPYQMNWDSTSIVNGPHTLTAAATNVDGITSVSAPINLTVNNASPTGGNMVPNASVETVNPNNSNAPLNWQTSKWGTNTTSFSYLTTGHSGGRSLKVQMTRYTSGDAKWYFAPQNVTGDTQYTYSDWYQSNVYSEVWVEFTLADGSTKYQFIGSQGASASAWTNFKSSFSVPLGAKQATVYHLIHGVGYLTTDDFSMQSYSPSGFNRALVTITYDDGILSTYNNGLPLMQKYGFVGTYYIISGVLNTSGYMTDQMVKNLYAGGNEIGSHTVTHPDLTSLTTTQLDQELSQSKNTLQQLIGTPVGNFAAPYGLYTALTTTETMKYYSTQRGIVSGFNSKDNFNYYDIRVQDVDINTTVAEVNDWLAQAQASHTWLVLLYHAVDPDSATAGQYDVTPTQLDNELSAIKNSGLPVVTFQQALNEIKPQL